MPKPVDPVKSAQGRRFKQEYHKPHSILAKAIGDRKLMAKIKAGREQMNGDTSTKLSQLVWGGQGSHMSW